MAKEKDIEVVVSKTREDFQALMDNYEKQNPAKFADKKEALLKKLASL